MAYLANHWRGNHSLVQSFWVNFLGLWILLILIEPLILAYFFSESDFRLNATLVSLVVTRLIIFPWQIVGLIRASDKHYLTHENILALRGVQIVMLVTVFYSLSHILSSLQTVLYEQENDELRARLLTAPQYQLLVEAAGEQIRIQGPLEIGLTRQLRELIANQPNVKTLVLESEGGNIFQGRGIASVIREYELTAYVDQTCSSACVIAFIAANERVLAPEGKLGFHQYRFDSEGKSAVVTQYQRPETQQDQDLEMFRGQGIADDFLQKVFKIPPEEIWFPESRELIESGVVTRIEALTMQ